MPLLKKMDCAKTNIEKILFASEPSEASGKLLTEKYFGRYALDNIDYRNPFARKTDVFTLLHVENGSGSFRLALEEYLISPKTIYFAYPGQLVSAVDLKRVKGYLLYARPDFILKANPNLLDFKLFQLYGERHEINLTGEVQTKLTSISDNICEELETSTYRKNEILANLVSLHIYYTDRCFFNQYFSKDQEQNPKARQFFALMNLQQNINLRVSEYASRLNISPNYLNEIIRKQTGKSVKSLIKEKTIRQACVYLMHTDYEVKEIANLLEYNYPQYFNRDFKNAIGITPTQYRQTYR